MKAKFACSWTRCFRSRRRKRHLRISNRVTSRSVFVCVRCRLSLLIGGAGQSCHQSEGRQQRRERGAEGRCQVGVIVSAWGHFHLFGAVVALIVCVLLSSLALSSVESSCPRCEYIESFCRSYQCLRSWNFVLQTGNFPSS